MKIINALRLLKKRKQIYLFFTLTFLLSLLPSLIVSVIVYTTSSQPSTFLYILTSLICCLIAGFLYYIGLFSISRTLSSEETSFQRLNLPIAISSALSFLLWFLLIQIFQKFFYSKIAIINLENITQTNFLNVETILSLTFLALLILISPFLLLSSILSFTNTSSTSSLRALKNSLKLFLKKPFSFIISFMLIAIFFISFHLFSPILYEYLNHLKLSPLATIFIEIALISWLFGLIVSVFAAAYFNYALTIPFEVTENKGNNNLKISILYSCIIIISLSILSLPTKRSIIDEFTKTIDKEIESAQVFAEKDQLDLAAYQYRKSYDFSDSLKNYLKFLLNQKDSTFSEAEKTKQKAELETIFKRALNSNYDNAYFQYLNSLRYKEQKNTDQQIKSLEASSKLLPDIPNVYYELIDYYKSSSNLDLKKETSNRLLEIKNYTSLDSLEKLNDKELKKLIEKMDEKAKTSYEKLPMLAYYYYENKLYEEAQAELAILSKKIPDDIVVNYLTAMVDLEMMQDNKSYDVALKAVDNIIKNNPKESWALDLKLQVATKAGNLEVMEKNLVEIYLKDPTNLDIAEQYAYTLMSKNRSFTMGDYDKKAEVILEKILKTSKDRWFALYCQSILDLKKGAYDKSLNNLISFSNIIKSQSNLFQMYDDFYYLYALKYKNFVAKPEAQKALEGIKTTNPLAYNYIYGTYYWSIKDAVKGKFCMNQAILQAPELSKTHFLLGNIYFENAFLKKVNADYPFAISEYKKALSIFEGDPYTWFSLGHVYKKLERYEDALGAFQKSVYYMPAEDHNFDHFGVSIHARMQVDEIKKKLGTK